MASKVAIAIKTEAAVQRLTHAAQLLSGQYGIAMLELPTHAKDMPTLRAIQLEHIATWLEAIATAPPKEENKNGSETPKREKRIHPQPHSNQ
jgi:hypothetical protein